MPSERTVAVRMGDFGAISSEWDALMERSATRSVFLTPVWQELCWRYLNDSGWDLFLLDVRAGNGPLGIAPLRRRGSAFLFIGNVEVSDCQDFVIEKGEEGTFYRLLLETLNTEEWTALELHGVPEGSPTLSQLPLLARDMGLSVIAEVEEVAPAVDLPVSWDAFLASLDKKARHELRRKMRRLSTYDSVRYYALEGLDAVSGVDDFLRLHKISSDEKAAFMGNKMEGFFRAMVPRLAEEGWVRLYFLEIKGERVSTALCFQYDDQALLYNSGFDPAYGWLSVGLLLKAFCIRDALESGMKRFDFLRGSEHYKYELGGVDVPIYRCLVQRS